MDTIQPKWLFDRRSAHQIMSDLLGFPPSNRLVSCGLRGDTLRPRWLSVTCALLIETEDSSEFSPEKHQIACGLRDRYAPARVGIYPVCCSEKKSGWSSSLFSRGTASKLRFKRPIRFGQSGYLPGALPIKECMIICFSEKHQVICDPRESDTLGPRKKLAWSFAYK